LETSIRLNNLFARVKVTAADRVLFCIHRGCTTPRAIMEKIGVSKGNLANYCKQLLAYNKIRRTRDTDSARGICYTLTPKGSIAVEKMLAGIDEVNAKGSRL
jgi:DNA-binding MarR family transcriptional regulator